MHLNMSSNYSLIKIKQRWINCFIRCLFYNMIKTSDVLNVRNVLPVSGLINLEYLPAIHSVFVFKNNQLNKRSESSNIALYTPLEWSTNSSEAS